MDNPLVSVICLCFNQEDFVRKTLKSVFSQDYHNIEIIVVDDCSTDGSREIIQNFLKSYPQTPFIALEENIGNTRAFNKGLAHANGKYIIDLSCDDILYPNKVSGQVEFFEAQHEKVGVIYSDIRYVDKQGDHLKFHFRGQKRVPFEGDIYARLIDTYFVPTQTMMIRKKVFDELRGYDENLAYEDFDFWIRSSRHWKYAYQDEVLMDLTVHSSSFSQLAYKPGDKQLHSTYLVCEKIKVLNKSPEEDIALIRRLQLEIRQAVFSANHDEADLFGQLLIKIGGMTFLYSILMGLNKLKLNLSFIRNTYHKLMYG